MPFSSFPSGAQTSPTSFPHLVHCSLAPASRAQYRRQVDTFITWLRAQPSLASLLFTPVAVTHAFEVYLLSLATPPRASTARLCVSAWAHLFTLGSLPVGPSRSHWCAVKALPALPHPIPRRSRVWFDPAWLAAAPFPTPLSALPYLAALLSWIYLLRVSELCRLRPSDFTTSHIRISPAKHTLPEVWRPIPDALRSCALFLSSYITDLPLFHSSQALTYVRALIPPPNRSAFTWHAFRRAGASTLLRLGAPMPSIALWGRWHGLGTLHTYLEPSAPLPPLPDPLTLWLPTGPSPSPFIRSSLPLRALWPPQVFTTDVSAHSRPTPSHSSPSSPPLSSTNAGSTLLGASPGLPTRSRNPRAPRSAPRAGKRQRSLPPPTDSTNASTGRRRHLQPNTHTAPSDGAGTPKRARSCRMRGAPS